MSWPQLLHVAEDHNGKIVGYVLAKMYVQEISEYNNSYSYQVFFTGKKKHKYHMDISLHLLCFELIASVALLPN
jgi:hypothetical protein